MEKEEKSYSLVRNIKLVYVLAFSVVSIFYVLSVITISYHERKAGVEHQVEDLTSFVLGYYTNSGSIYHQDFKVGLSTSFVQDILEREDYEQLEKMIRERRLARSSDFVVLLDEGNPKFTVNRYNYNMYRQLLRQLSDAEVLSKILNKTEVLIVFNGRVISAANMPLEGTKERYMLAFSEVTSNVLNRYTSFMSQRFYIENITANSETVNIIDLSKQVDVKLESLKFESNQYISRSGLYQGEQRYFDLIMYEDYSIANVNKATWVAIISLPLGAILITGIWLLFSRRNLEPVKNMVHSLRRSSSIDIDSGPDELLVFSRNYKRLAKELESKNHFNELLIGSITDMIFTVDDKGQVNFANDAALDWLGLDMMSIEGRQASLLFSNMDRDSSDVATWIHRVSERNETVKAQGDLVPITGREWVYQSEITCQPLDRNSRRSSAIVIIKVLERMEIDSYLSVQKV